MKLWRVEHFWTLFVFTFGRDCYCIQQSPPKMKTKSVQKCSTRQSFTFPKWNFFKIGTLEKKLFFDYTEHFSHKYFPRKKGVFFLYNLSSLHPLEIQKLDEDNILLILLSND